MSSQEKELTDNELEKLKEKEKNLLDYEFKFILRIVNTLLTVVLIFLTLTTIIQILRLI